MSDAPLSYRAAGVDLDAAQRHTANIAPMLHAGALGFAAALPLPPMRDGMLVACTDGVGTKLLLARELGRIDGLGQDLVAMCVNDLVCCGARPLGFLDYLAVGRLDTDEAALLVASIAQACEESGLVLLGGETAEMPGLYAPGHFDLAGFACGVVERDAVLGPDRVGVGDILVGVNSSGIHSNGFSLVRALVADGALAADADLLLAPTRLYAKNVAQLQQAEIPLHAIAHITGGGLPENLPRVMPAGLRPVLHVDSWQPGAAINAVLASGRVSSDEAWRTFNMGIGLCVVAPQESAARIVQLVDGAQVIGFIEAGDAGVRFV